MFLVNVGEEKLIVHEVNGFFATRIMTMRTGNSSALDGIGRIRISNY